MVQEETEKNALQQKFIYALGINHSLTKDFRYSVKEFLFPERIWINEKTLNDRQTSFKPLRLKPGEYIFRVTNRDVPYELDFYLQRQGLSQATLPKASGGGLGKGGTQDYRVTLKPRKYMLCRPLNPTPDYPLVVQ